MGWLLELLFEAVRELCSQFIVDMMDIASTMFTEILSCDLDLFEDLFGVAGDLYTNAVLPIAIAMLLMILTWQVFKSMFGKLGVNSEDPVELAFRSAICLFMLVYAKDIVNYILEVVGTPYQWVVGTEITVDSFSGYVSAAEAAVSVLGVDAISISLLLLIMHFVVAWNYFKLLFILAERYVLLGVFSYTAPLAFATGGAKATNNILASWSKMFGGQVLLVVLDAWCLKMFLSGYGNLMATGTGFTKFFAATMCLIGFCKIAGKLDSYMASMGVSMGRTMGGLSGLGALMMAGRLLQGGRSAGGSSASSGSGHMNFGGGRSIPLGTASQSPAAGGMSAMSADMGVGLGGMGPASGDVSGDGMTGDVPGMEKGLDNPNMGDGFDVFQPDEPMPGGQSLPFGEPEDSGAYTQEAEDGIAAAPFGMEEEGRDWSDLEGEAGIPFGDGGDLSWDDGLQAAGEFQADGEAFMPDDSVGGMDAGGDSGITGWESAGESGIPDLADGNDGTSGFQDGGECMAGGAEAGTPFFGGAETGETLGTAAEQSYIGSAGTGGAEVSPGEAAVSAGEAAGGISGMGTSGSGQVLHTGDAPSAAEAGSIPGDGRTDGSLNHGETASLSGTGMAPGRDVYGNPAGSWMQNAMPETQRGCYQAERDGKQYMRFDSGQYEKPKGPYQTIHENGRTFYEIPKQDVAPALRPETKAVLEKDGTIRLEQTYRQKETTQTAAEVKIPKIPAEEKPAEKKAGKKPLRKQTGKRNRRKDTP